MKMQQKCCNYLNLSAVAVSLSVSPQKARIMKI